MISLVHRVKSGSDHKYVQPISDEGLSGNDHRKSIPDVFHDEFQSCHPLPTGTGVGFGDRDLIRGYYKRVTRLSLKASVWEKDTLS